MKGLRIVENRNGITVAWLHYSADPDKDPATKEGLRFVADVKRGITASMFEKEYEINFRALRGKRVYEEWDRAWHVVEDYLIPRHWTRIMSLDPGLANPTAVLWAAVKPDGDIVLYQEYYERERIAKEHASAFRSLEGQDKITWRVMDIQAWARSPKDKSTIAQDYQKERFYFQKSTKDEVGEIDIVKGYLKVIPELGNVVGNPKLTVFASLENFIWEIEKWKYPEQSPSVAERKNLVETPEDKDNHLMDCLRNMLAKRPKYRKPGGSMKTVEIVR